VPAQDDFFFDIAIMMSSLIRGVVMLCREGDSLAGNLPRLFRTWCLFCKCPQVELGRLNLAGHNLAGAYNW
jgi:hypothetical protein